mmetsp:Transcript_32042/g.76154  ORF Transcript_32042/g.76154 Transcript_32042/m.76154 type:complete len:267 (-) Transcript_32042:443-1243(-)
MTCAAGVERLERPPGALHEELECLVTGGGPAGNAHSPQRGALGDAADPLGPGAAPADVELLEAARRVQEEPQHVVRHVACAELCPRRPHGHASRDLGDDKPRQPAPGLAEGGGRPRLPPVGPSQPVDEEPLEVRAASLEAVQREADPPHQGARGRQRERPQAVHASEGRGSAARVDDRPQPTVRQVRAVLRLEVPEAVRESAPADRLERAVDRALALGLGDEPGKAQRRQARHLGRCLGYCRFAEAGSLRQVQEAKPATSPDHGGQ